MKSVEHLIEFIKDKLSREEQIYLAAQIQVEIYKNKIASVSAAVEVNDPKTIRFEDVTAPSHNADPAPQLPIVEHVGLFSSIDGKDIQYTFLLKKAVTSRPKTIDKLRNFITTTCNGYGGLKSSDLDIVLNQLKIDNLFKIEDDGTLVWSIN